MANVKLQAIITCQRDGWKWQIEEQSEDGESVCDLGVDIVYIADGAITGDRTCIGNLEDAEALAKAILAYVEFKRR